MTSSTAGHVSWTEGMCAGNTDCRLVGGHTLLVFALYRPPETILRSYDRRYGRSRSRSRDRREYGRMERSGELDDDDIKSVFVKNVSHHIYKIIYMD